MRVLWLVRYPPLESEKGGDAVYSRNLIAHTAKQADVHVLTFAPNSADLAGELGVTWHSVPPRRHSRVAGLFSRFPDVAYRHDDPTFVDQAIVAARDSDAVVVDHVGLLFVVERLRSVLGERCPPIILVHHDHEASLRKEMAAGARNPLMRAVLHADAIKAGRLEGQSSRTADGLTAITTTDLDAFRIDAPGTPGILLMPGYAGPLRSTRVIDDRVPERFCVLGGRSSYHKQLVLDRTLDAIASAGLQRRFIVDVVGGREGPDPRYPGVNFVGYVDDLASYLETVRLGVIPDDIGGGFKVRALTHVFLRVPMVALDVAMRGMTLRSGGDYLGAGDLRELIGTTVPQAMTNTALLNQVQNEAFEHCQGRFAWSDRAAALLEFAQLLRYKRNSSEGCTL